MKDNYYTSAMNIGPCGRLVGNVMVEFVFLRKPFAPYDQARVNNWVAESYKMAARLERDAGQRGIRLRMEVTWHNVTDNHGYTSKDRDVWISSVMKTMGYSSLSDFQQKVARKNRADSVAVIFAVDQEDRAYAVSADTRYPNASEYAVIFRDCEAGSMAHELLHLYGAQDFYYPAYVEKWAKELLPNSIMQDSTKEIDPLTAYLIGWRRTPGPAGEEFLRRTGEVSYDVINHERSKQLITGYGQREYSDRTYRGDMVSGWADGQGTMEWADGTKYTGSWKKGQRHGFGTMVWPSGVRYQGAWTDGSFGPYGTCWYTSGDVYVGHWLNGSPDGEGSMTWSNGARSIGTWRQGKLVSGMYTDKNGVSSPVREATRA